MTSTNKEKKRTMGFPAGNNTPGLHHDNHIHHQRLLLVTDFPQLEK